MVTMTMIALLLSLGVVSASARDAAPSSGLTGPCRGHTQSNYKIQAIEVGRSLRANSKLVLAVETDIVGKPEGTLIFGQQSGRIEVSSWCRLWQSSGGEITHLLGFWNDQSGEEALIRIDVKSSETMAFRLRSRLISISGHRSDEYRGEDEDEGWTLLTGEGWLPLTRLRQGAIGSSLKWTTKK